MEELEKERKSYVVDMHNVMAHLSAYIEKLKKEKEELEAKLADSKVERLRKEKEDLEVRLQASEENFAKADAAVKVFGQCGLTNFIEGFCLVRAQILEENLYVRPSSLADF